MRRMRAGRWVSVALLLAMGGVAAQAGEFAIQSFDRRGRLTFKEVSEAEKYRVEWASTPGGPWTNTWAEIVASGSGIATCLVSMCDSPSRFFRVVALTLPPGMVLIPGGTNTGTDPDSGAYSLTVNAFYMDKHEVTKAKWDEVYVWAMANGYSFDNVGSEKAAGHPVNGVNWYDCVKWCNARSQKEGRPAVYRVGGAVYKTGQADNVVQTSVAGYRLPTDVEWEYAARGGVASRRFPWGDTIDHSWANYNGDPSGYKYDKGYFGFDERYEKDEEPYTSPVGRFAANGYGLYDMAGNVFEWCFDWEPGLEDTTRVLRGGSWYDDANVCRVGSRVGFWPDFAVDDLGFRTVLPPEQP